MGVSDKEEATNFITRMKRSGIILSCVQHDVLPSIFIKVKGMLEKAIHEESKRYIIVESLRAGMNKRKTSGVYTPAPATPQVKWSSGVIPSSGGKQQLIQIWLRLHSGCCSLTKNRRRILVCLTLFAKVSSENWKNLARPWMKLMP